jgi:hypothetical protein
MKRFCLPLALLVIWAGCAKDKTAPTVTVTAPSNGATVQDTVAVNVTVEDNKSVSRVEIYIDNAIVDTFEAEPYTYNWITNPLADSSQHTIYAQAFDAADNMGVSDTVSVRVVNTLYLPPPTLALPPNGGTITQNPPTLVWYSVNLPQIVYRFEVAADSLFGTIVFSSGPVIPPDTFYTLDSVLAAGTYYWHACTRQNC